MYSERFDHLLDGLLESVGENKGISKGEKEHIVIHDLSKQKMYEKINDCIEKLNYGLKGTCFRFNLETDIDRHKTQPISQKLRHIITKILCKIFYRIENEHANNMLILMKSVYDFFHSHFLSGTFKPYKKLFLFILNDIVSSNGIEYLPINTLDSHLESYTDKELLGSMMLLDIFQLKLKNNQKHKLFYIFDNFDMIENSSVLHNFLGAYNQFVTDFNLVVNKLRSYKSNYFDFNFTADYCCIFFMRDTTARRINEHDYGRLLSYSVNFDSSEYIDKGKIVLRRYEYIANRQIIKNINKKLFDETEMLSRVLNDDYVRLNIAGLFNNDYVRFITCLTELFSSNYNDLKEYLNIKENNDSLDIFSHEGLVRYGARGILFRTIFEHLKEKGYLSQLDINGSMQKHGYTQARLVLFYLFCKQPMHYSSFLNSRNTLVTFSDLRRDFRNIFNTGNKSDQKSIEDETVRILADVLWNMYDLKKSHTWAHLVTFDAIYPDNHKDVLDDDLTRKDIEDALSNWSAGHVSITCAGRSYVEFMCSHFEYFSMRFNMSSSRNNRDSKNNLNSIYEHALFSKATYSQDYYDSSGKYLFEDLLTQFNADFSKCLKKLTEREEKMFERVGLYNKTSILESPFVFYHPRKKYPRRHLERAMQRIITYMDAYRLFLVNNIAKENETQLLYFNKKMIEYIRMFVDLMKKYLYCFSSVSAHIVSRYYKNINIIVDSEYRDTRIILDSMDDNR